MRLLLRGASRRVITSGSLLVLGYLVIIPVSLLLLATVIVSNGTFPIDARNHLGLDNYLRVLTDPELWPVLRNTVIFTVGSLVVGLSISTALAWLVERTDFPYRELAYVIVVGPIAVPALLLSIAWVLILSPNAGLVNLAIRAVLGLQGSGPLSGYSLLAMILVQGILIVPISFIMLAAAFGNMNAALEEAAATAGARPRQTFWRITLPLAVPAILAVTIFQFVTVVQAFDVPAVLGLQAKVTLLSTRVFLALTPPFGLPDYGLASVYAVVLLAASLLPLAAYYRLIGRTDRYATVGGKAFRPKRVALGRWKIPALLFTIAFALVSFVLPVFVMFWSSVQPYYAAPSLEALNRLTLAAYQDLLSRPVFATALLNTVILAVASATIVTVLALLEAWAVVRVRSGASLLIDVLAFATHAVPGIVVALSLLITYITIGNVVRPSLYGTIWLLVLGMVTVSVGSSTRIMAVSVNQLHRELEEAAEVSGASPLAVLRHVVGPLMRPALANVWVLVLLAAATNLTLTLALNSGTNTVLSVQIYSSWNFGDVAGACATGVLLMVVSLVTVYAVRRSVVRKAVV